MEFGFARTQIDGRLRLRPLLDIGASERAYSTRRGAPGLSTAGEISVAVDFEIIICSARSQSYLWIKGGLPTRYRQTFFNLSWEWRFGTANSRHSSFVLKQISARSWLKYFALAERAPKVVASSLDNLYSVPCCSIFLTALAPCRLATGPPVFWGWWGWLYANARLRLLRVQ